MMMLETYETIKQVYIHLLQVQEKRYEAQGLLCRLRALLALAEDRAEQEVQEYYEGLANDKLAVRAKKINKSTTYDIDEK